MKLLKPIFACLITALMLSACKKDDTLKITITHDLQIPAPLLEIADAFVTYHDQEGYHTEAIPQGKFYHTSVFLWKGTDVIEKSVEDKFDDVVVTLKLKVPESELQEGAKLLNDPSAYYAYNYKLTRDYEDKNFFTGQNGSSSSSTTKVDRYSYSREEMNYEYTVAEQIKFFNDQERNPLYEMYCSKAANTINININFHDGQLDSKANPKKESFKLW